MSMEISRRSPARPGIADARRFLHNDAAVFAQSVAGGRRAGAPAVARGAPRLQLVIMPRQANLVRCTVRSLMKLSF